MSQKCSGCGAEIPEGSKLGACPKCLLSVGLDADGRITPASETVKFESFDDYLFEKQWALTLIESAMGRLRTKYVADGKGDLFEDLKSFLAAKKATPHADLATKHGITASAIGVAIHRLRQQYAALLREEIAATVNDPSEIDDEIRCLIAALGG